MPKIEVTSRLTSVLREVVGFSEASLQQKNLALFSARGSIDSVSLLLLVMAIEKQFDIVIDDKEVQPKNFKSLKTLAAFIERKLASRKIS